MTKRIGLIVPASNTAVETQLPRLAPAGVGVHTTRLRMTGRWSRPLRDLAGDITRASEALSDIDPGVIVFHCTANSMSEGLAGEARILELVAKASGRPALTTSLAIREALDAMGLRKLVLISPYAKTINAHEIAFLGEAGYAVVHDHGLGIAGDGDAYLRITPREWVDLTVAHRRDEADGYFLSCAATTMIDAIEEIERRLDKPVVNSNQAVLWAALRRLDLSEPIASLGRLFAREAASPRR
jgi:maleate isomerase